MPDEAERFVHTGLPQRVVFGRGSIADLADEIERLDLHRVLVLSSPGRSADAQRLADTLGSSAVGVHARARVHVPTATAAAAVARARELESDGCITFGGGSAIGLGKAVALETGTPIVAIPTTYAGSEMTPVWGLTDGSTKTTGRDPQVLPATVIYDPDLTDDLPVETSVVSAVNALAHAVEALYAANRTPVTDLMAAESVRALLAGVEQLVHGDDSVAREKLLTGSWLAGSVLAVTSMSLHHQICHIAAAMFDLPHAWTHTAALPHVMRVMLRPGDHAHTLLTQAIGSDDPARAVHTLLERLGYSRSLATLGFMPEGVDHVVRKVMSAPYPTPHPISAGDVRSIVTEAYAGSLVR